MTQTSPEENDFPHFRSPHLLSRQNSALIVVDVQEKLIPHVQNSSSLVWNIERLIRGAQAMDVPVRVTEQYPTGLGGTIGCIGSLLGDDAEIPAKTLFSCRQCTHMIAGLAESGVHQLVLVGIETHVCVAQSAFDLMAAGFTVFLCLDAIGSRHTLDHDTAISRMENGGVTPITTESILFEWCETSDDPGFKTISKLVQEKHP